MCDDKTGVEKYILKTMNKGKNTTDKNICHCNFIHFPPHT